MDPTTPDRFFPPFLGEYDRRDRDTSAKKAESSLLFDDFDILLPRFFVGG